MCTENHADEFGVAAGEISKLDAQINAGALPGQEANLITKYFLGQLFRILASRNGNYSISMHMINMLVRHIAMKTSVDRWRA